MKKSIKKQFYMIVGFTLTISSILIVYMLVLNHRMNTQINTVIHTVNLERKISSAVEEFQDARYLQRKILSSGLIKAEDEIAYDNKLTAMQEILSSIHTVFYANSSDSPVMEVMQNIDQNRQLFAELVQLKTKDRINRTKIDETYKNIVSSVLMQSDMYLIRQLFNIARFKNDYFIFKNASKVKVIKIVANAFKRKVISKEIVQGRISVLIDTYTALIDANFARHNNIHKLDVRFEALSQGVKEDLEHITLATRDIAIRTNQKAQLMLRNIKYSMLLVSIILLTSLLFLMWMINRRVIRPINVLSNLARAVDNGDMDARCNVEGADELASLSGLINQMLDTLKMRNEELLSFQRNLEEKVNSRTLDLNIAMEKSQAYAKQAEEANQTKSQFLANMSHEIRTPMNGVIGFNNLLEKTQMTPQQMDYVHKAGSSAQNLLRIINDILDFSKIEANEFELDNVEFNLNEVLEKVSNIVAIKAFEKGVEFLLSKSDGTPVNLVGDPLRLEQILLNFTNNAVKFTAKGEIVVRVSLKETYAQKARINFEVIDTGIGLTREQIQKMFKPFTQADASTTREYGGTGLGLSISKHLVEMMNGKVGVESDYGRGSNFYFNALFDINPNPNNDIPAQIIPKILKNIKIMLVDDHEATIEVMNNYLESYGLSFKIITAGSGSQAINAYNTSIQDGETIDLILMDWKMPGMNGIETWKKIKEINGQSKLPKIIILTAYVMENGLDRAKSDGIHDILMKPVSQSSLFDAILNVFAHGPKHDIPLALTDKFDGLGGAKILVVEDNKFNQALLKGILKQGDFQVEMADDGLQAIEKLTADQSYDLVLMDLQMPNLDGYKATKRLRKNPAFANLPIIALSADAMKGTREQALQAGMNDYLTKPIDTKKLFTLIGKWIAKDAWNGRG